MHGNLFLGFVLVLVGCMLATSLAQARKYYALQIYWSNTCSNS